MLTKFSIGDKKLKKYLKAIANSTKQVYISEIEIELFKEAIIDFRGAVKDIRALKHKPYLGFRGFIAILAELEDSFILVEFCPSLDTDRFDIIGDFDKYDIDFLIEEIEGYIS